MDDLLVCVQCGFTHAEFRARGLLGCPACYDQLGEALRADLLHVHSTLYRRPFVNTAPRAPAPGMEDVATLREKLGDALRHERYEEAAALRRRLDERGNPA
jgi:protein arginine kinase activator